MERDQEIEDGEKVEQLETATKIDGLIMVARTLNYVNPICSLDMPSTLSYTNVKPSYFKGSKKLECSGSIFFTRIGSLCDMGCYLAFTSKLQFFYL